MDSTARRMYRIEVKAKQGPVWPNCRGIATEDTFLVFVDFAGKIDTMRPDFYVLTLRDWGAIVEAVKREYKAKHPARRFEIRVLPSATR